MDAIRQQTDSSVAIWEVLQMTNMRVYHKDCSDCITPTFDMERSITWQAIVRGANGIIYYSFFDMMSGCHRTSTCPLDVSNTTQWSRIKIIATEVERFAPILLSNAGAAPAVSVLNITGAAPSWIATRERWDDKAPGTMFIFAANDGDGSGEVTFVLGGGLLASGGSHVEVLSEAPTRKIPLKAGSDRFVDTSHAMDVAVYKLQASPSAGSASIIVPSRGANLKHDDPEAFSLRDDHPIATALPPRYLENWTVSSASAGVSVPAAVPGDVISDLHRAGVIPDPMFGVNWREPLYVNIWNRNDWIYRTTFVLPATKAQTLQHALVFEGVKTGASIAVNGVLVGVAVDQFLRYSFDLAGVGLRAG
jgi:hypothetical protein